MSVLLSFENPLIRLLAHLIFYSASFFWTLFIFSASFFLLWGPRRWIRGVACFWGQGILSLAQYFLGIGISIEGRQHLPTKGPFLVACKHQSPWETLALQVIFRDPAFFLKNTLLSVPIIGWFLKKLKMIPVSKKKSKKDSATMKHLLEQALAEKRVIIIFPEGTRTHPGTTVPYRQGVFSFYQTYHLTVIPAALNSGLFWKKHTLFKKSGIIRLVFLPPIFPGLERKDFMNHLVESIEETSKKLTFQNPNDL